MAFDPVIKETSRDIWSHGSGSELRDLLASSFCTLLLLEGETQPVYFSSPWMSDFVLFENRFHEFERLFPELDTSAEIKFSDYLVRLSRKLAVRIITTQSNASLSFLQRLKQIAGQNVQSRFVPDEYHEKGILAPSFYIEGSMNITYHGVYIRGEKITYHHAQNSHSARKIAGAYLEYNRRWANLG